MSDRLKELEDKIHYIFHDRSLLENALTHSSYANEKGMPKTACNERLEFLGDAVLELVSSDYLFHRFPEKPEGFLSRTRASMVCEPALAYCASLIQLGSYLYMGKGEENTGGRERASVTSDAMEALTGAIYKDGGFDQAKAFIMKYILDDQENKRLFYDSKTVLQEIVQAHFPSPVMYRQAGESGPDHNKSFTFEVILDGELLGRGEGHSKKAAEQKAAYEAILALRSRGIQ